MCSAAFATLAALTLLAPAPDPRGAPAPHRQHVTVRRAQTAAPERVPLPGDLYAARAKRRIAAYLRMRLAELRLERLDRAAQVIERRLPVDALLGVP